MSLIARLGPPAALAVLSGLSLLLAHPPVGRWWTVFLVPAALLGATALETRRAADEGRRPAVARWGLLAGLVAYLPMLTWLITPAGAMAWVLLATIQAAYLAAFALLIRPVVLTRWAVAVAPLLWTGLDAIRGAYPLGGFDWGSLAYAHVDGSWMLPVARLVGHRGITLLTVGIGAALFEVVRRSWAATDGLPGSFRDHVKAGLPHTQPAVGILVGLLLVSILATVEPPATTGETLEVLAVQGNDVEGSFTGSAADEDLVIAEQMRDLTVAAVAEGGAPDLTVWPESSIDRDPFTDRGADLRPLVEESAAAVGGDLIVGVNRVGPRARTFVNSSLVLDEDGTIVDAYAKRHLVPFGEYVPWRDLIGDLPPLQAVPNDAIAGEAAQTLTAAGVPVAVAICFETLFPEVVRSNVLAGEEPAQLILATTNDASFGRSAEPAQHLAQSRMRAVETGRWVVHSSLSGSSAFVDPEGGAHDLTPLFERATIRADVPLVSGRTPFLVIGDVVGTATRALVVLWILGLVVDRVRRTRTAAAAPASMGEPS